MVMSFRQGNEIALTTNETLIYSSSLSSFFNSIPYYKAILKVQL
ncbi:hypothetical protein BVRB_8g196600 [Beta vulgaris subsp. vulgaris]|nr:hypothetical protein BVRB_8g196600 [Beta vulgaris subsp. vulgaris]